MKKIVYVRAIDFNKFEDQVNEEVQKGYELHGSLVTYEQKAEDWTGPRTVFVQALILSDTQSN